MRIFTLILSALLCASFVYSIPPDRKDPDPKKKKDEIPDLAKTLNGPVGSSNWGTVHLDRATGYIKLTDHPRWTAEGRVTKDGKVSLMWTDTEDGRRAPGYYEWDGKELRGVWNYGTLVEVQPDGTLKGDVQSDHIYPLPPPPIDF